MTDLREAPAVPAGPGAQPPFAAAPVEGRTARRWLGAGVAAAVVAVVCAVGVIAVGGLVVTMIPAMNEQARRAVGDYLDALIEQDWQQAYELRCDQDRQAESLAEFTRVVAVEPPIESYELGELDLFDAQADQLQLPAELRYEDGSTERRTYPLAPDQATGTLRVCQHG